MADCFPLIKYIYVFVLFIFGFIGWNNPALEIIGYSGVFVTQCIFTILLLIDISNDTGRASKTLDFTLLQSVYSRITSTYKIPLYLVLLVGIFLQFTCSFLMMITTSTLYRKYQKISKMLKMLILLSCINFLQAQIDSRDWARSSGCRR
jgi:hypothetical protein